MRCIGHGTLAGEYPERFSQEVQAAQRCSLQKANSICPAAEFAIWHGLTDIMPALCNVDFASMELLHTRLIRKTTCANGEKCDDTICGDKDPYLKDHPAYRNEAGYRRNR